LSHAHGAAQSGRHTVLLGPFTPEQLDDLPGRRWVGDVRFAVLDCADDARRARLTARPKWRERAVERHVDFAAHLRATIPAVFHTDDGTPPEVARRLADWITEARSGTGR
jgi:hypothetical protein